MTEMNQGFEIGTSGYPAGVGDTTDGGGLGTLFANPQFLSLLAGIGARLDPQGVGGALGGAAQEYIKGKAALSSAQDIQARQDRRRADLMRALGEGYHTPREVQGPTTTTITDKSIKETGREGDTEYTKTTPLPAALQPNATPQAPGDYSTAIPQNTPPVTTSPVSSTAPSRGVPLTQSNPARNFYPFFQALLG